MVATSTMTRGAFGQATNDDHLDQCAADRRGEQCEMRVRASTGSASARPDREERGRGQSEVGDGEVDDARRAVDEDDRHRQDRHDQALDETDEQQVGRRDLAVAAATRASAALGPEEHGPGEVVPFEQLLGVASNLTVPFSRKMARSEIASATLSDCSTIIIVCPRARSRSTSSRSRCTTTGARPSDSSSMRRISGSCISTRAKRQHLLLAARQALRELLRPLRELGEELEYIVMRASISAAVPRADVRRP